MQLEVIRGPAASGKTTQLRQIAKADGQDEGHIAHSEGFHSRGTEEPNPLPGRSWRQSGVH